MFRLTSDGKTPDCQPFRDALNEAVGKAAKQGGRDIAAQMTAQEKQVAAHRQQRQREEGNAQRLADREARQQRLAQFEAAKAERKAQPIRDVVRELLPSAIEIESADGFLFNTRRLVYRIRDEVLQRSGKELKQNYFDDLLTEIEAEQGSLSPLLIRDPRGNYSIPHSPGDAIPLGTQSVREFRRPGWAFNKVVVIEKEDLRLMLRQAGWDRRHDDFLLSAQGFNTRAARDLIDAIAETTEPVKVFSVHDGDWAGTLIQHTLQHATRARGERKIEIIDLGIQPWEAMALRLPVETVLAGSTKKSKPRRLAVGAYVRARTDKAPSGETWEEWLQHSRVELNAFTSVELIRWLDQKMAKAGAGKVIPPDDILRDEFGEWVRGRAQSAVETALDQRLDKTVGGIEAERAEATKEIRAEINRIIAPLRTQLDLASEPFRQRIEKARAEALSIDREAEVHRAIGRITPGADKLQKAINKALTKRPMRQWSAVLHEIADGTKVLLDEIDRDQGGAA